MLHWGLLSLPSDAFKAYLKCWDQCLALKGGFWVQSYLVFSHGSLERSVSASEITCSAPLSLALRAVYSFPSQKVTSSWVI